MGQDGMPKEEVEVFRDDLLNQCRLMGKDAEDVPDDSEAWAKCRVQLKHQSPLVAFYFQAKEDSGLKVTCQTTVKAAGGIMQAERLARLCYNRFESGATKDQVV